MPMTYREFRDLYHGMGAEELGRQQAAGYDIVFVGKRERIVFPQAFPHHPISLPEGDDTILEDEEIEIHLRNIKRLLGIPGSLHQF